MHRLTGILLFMLLASNNCRADVFYDQDEEDDSDAVAPEIKKYKKNALCLKKHPIDMTPETSCQHVWNMNPPEHIPYDIHFPDDYLNETDELDDLKCFVCAAMYSRYEECSKEEPEVELLHQCSDNKCPKENEELQGQRHAVRRCALGMTDQKLTCPDDGGRTVCYVVIPCSVDVCDGFSGGHVTYPGMVTTLFCLLAVKFFTDHNAI